MDLGIKGKVAVVAPGYFMTDRVRELINKRAGDTILIDGGMYQGLM